MAVDARDASDVSAALMFASAHNIRAVVKATGHEYQGRSTAAGSLLVWLHNLKGFNMSISQGFAACPGDVPIPAITTSPGNGWGDLYAALNNSGWAVVGGSARTVSSAGGYTLGGGHSFLGPSHGMAVDNVLAFGGVVLANGTVIPWVSACSHPDLFWALRGGGGGSFAVVTSATYRLHPVQPVTGLRIVVAMLKGLPSASKLLAGFFAATTTLSVPYTADGSYGVWAGYWNWAVDATSNVFSATLVFNGSSASATASEAGFAAFLQAGSTSGGGSGDFYIVDHAFSPFPSMYAWHDEIDPAATGDRTGTPVTIGSRLLPLAACASPARAAAFADALVTGGAYGVPVFGHLVAGGAVAAADAGSAATSITPAWRAATHHIAFGAGWALNATLGDQASIVSGLHNLTELLRGAEPDSGAYFSESDPANDASWTADFWGEANYARLQAIKAAYDPQGRFTCHHCVQLPAPSRGTAEVASGQ